jgi:hypothetical protein
MECAGSKEGGKFLPQIRVELHHKSFAPRVLRHQNYLDLSITLEQGRRVVVMYSSRGGPLLKPCFGGGLKLDSRERRGK